MSLAILFHFQASACNTDTTPTQPHRNSNTHRTNNTMNVVIQQNSRKLQMMDILMCETCWAHKKWNKIASDIKLVFYSSTIKMMQGPIKIHSKTVQTAKATLKIWTKSEINTATFVPIIKSCNNFRWWHKIYQLFLKKIKTRNMCCVLPNFIPEEYILRNWFLGLYCPFWGSCWTYCWDQKTQTCQ